MLTSFKGTLYINGSPTGLPVRVSFEFDLLRFTLDDGNIFEANFDLVKLSQGGFENRLVEIKAVSTNNCAIFCYIDLEYVDSFLEYAQHPGVNINQTQVKNIKQALATSRRIQFLFDWGLYIAGAISLIGYFLI